MKTNIGLVLKTSVLCAFVLALSAGVPGDANAKPHSPKGHGYGRDYNPSAGRESVPEIDPSTATLAVGVAGSALAILRDRRRRR